VEEIAARNGLEIGTFGHAGDGNMHPTIVYDPTDEDEAGRARCAFREILGLSLSLGGTLSGEHGIGSLKQAHLAAELGESLQLNRAVKRALDPGEILNPGKAI
jgi:glycolate dehydrogenase FAD-linked subunit